MPNDDEFAKRGSSFPEAVRYLHENHRTLSPFLATTLALMSEVARGGESGWAAYVGTLPASCPDCLLNWSKEEKKDLEGTVLEELGPDPAADAFKRHVAPILAARRDLWPRQAAEVAEAADATDADLALFVRVAGLVQSRAFHLEAQNWVSGAKEISKLDGGGTQVFLLPGIDMINHSHNPARRNAHLQRLNVAEAAAAKLTEAAGAPEGVEAYFVMRADKPIAAGEEVLHTYGNLSDAQLLQTYGFLDSEDDFAQLPSGSGASGSQQAEEDKEEEQEKGGKGGKKGAAGKKRGKPGAAAGKGEKEEAAEGAGGGGGYRNPYNAALVSWEAVEDVCCSLMKSMDQGPPAALKRAKRDFLAAAGVLQAAAPEATQFVLLAREPLPDELLTAVQVLLMTKEEFNELKREHGGEQAGAAGGSAGKKGAAAVGKSPAKGKKGKGGAAAKQEEAAAKGGEGGAPAALPKLHLGTALLEEDEDFAEMVCIAMLQVLKSCVERYPTTSKEDVRLLKSADCTGRQRLAVRVRLGEKDVLQMGQKAVVELLRKLREGEPVGKDEDEEDDEEEEEEEEEKAGKKGGAKGKGKAKKPAAKKRRGLGAEASSDEGDEEDGDVMEAEAAATAADEEEDDDGLLAGSDDSDRVGYGAEDFDDGPGEAHDRGKPHEAPKASE
ncbi:hypothetical protein HYH02_001079 [Chlamydomonas schloesseri]|uniref:Rubisco LSMT substrate-binding domain-containing protein n=1 Tax=Chlamydomonas schloesseri TaxID=2026947 RepID=A0A835WVM6_9CHLO|nr:hypothetical protein HYH02_001079 [Chlamydomonas schloesseri]|eukprot:KAG2454038.1 hypothetical protein HYH02_001079 [Chlamydomonas schloesseri]